jgi:hypothetical protein
MLFDSYSLFKEQPEITFKKLEYPELVMRMQYTVQTGNLDEAKTKKGNKIYQ